MNDEYVAINLEHLTDIAEVVRSRNRSNYGGYSTYYPSELPNKIVDLPTAEEYLNSFATRSFSGAFYSEEVTKVKKSAFAGFENITSITVPNAAEVNGEAFTNCPNLKLIAITCPNVVLTSSINAENATVRLGRNPSFANTNISIYASGISLDRNDYNMVMQLKREYDTSTTSRRMLEAYLNGLFVTRYPSCWN